jgi:3-oxoacyl-[acyl-carrier protein] reductase
MNSDVRGKRVLVTGGTRGIGRAVVLAFVEHGATVYTCGRTESPAAAGLRAEVAGWGRSHQVDIADLANPIQCRGLVTRAVDALGGIDVLVNNAGVMGRRTLLEMDDDEWMRVLDTNLRGTMEITRAALPALSDGGSLIHITSAAASTGMAGSTHYTASKAAIVGFNRSLCKEIGPRGIRANVVAPGVIETDQAAEMAPEMRKWCEQLAALQRLGKPADVAAVVIFLASGLSGFVSGQTIVVDGGI